MTKKHLYPNKFFNARLWDYTKWPFALSTLALILYLIWAHLTGIDIIAQFPEQWQPVIEKINAFLIDGI